MFVDFKNWWQDYNETRKEGLTNTKCEYIQIHNYPVTENHNIQLRSQFIMTTVIAFYVPKRLNQYIIYCPVHV